jgi:hypothetical protein
MSATIVVEDGTGKTDANSYISTTTGDAVLEEVYLLMGLSSAPTLNDIDCIAGTRYIDVVFGSRWMGIRSNEDQALDWPRTYVPDGQEYYFDSDEIPSELEKACALYAYYAQTDGSNMIPNQQDEGAVKSETLKAGPISKSVEYTGGNSATKMYRLSEGFLSKLLKPGDIVGRI